MKIVRVGVMNNFNFTNKEIEHLKKISSGNLAFVNSNSFVEIKPDFPSIITINPYLSFVKPEGDLSNVCANRVKIVCGANNVTHNEQMNAIAWSVSNGIPVLITFQRWRKISEMERFGNALVKEKYYYDKPWQRPTKEAKEFEYRGINLFVKNTFPRETRKMVYFCDWNGNGCEECQNCMRLTYPEFLDQKIWSLNLSTSGNGGRCIFHCPDCFAKHCLNICRTKTPRLDEIYRNKKQRGAVHHE